MHMNDNKEKQIGILGYGEIGKAVARFYESPLIRDIDTNEFVVNLDVLHVCIPFIDNFYEIVSENITEYRPRLVIIHSTVGVGETKKLYDRFGNVVHSPVRGVHPNLYEGIKTFVKYVGCDREDLGVLVSAHFNSIGIEKTKVCVPSATTELGKLLDTTYYGLCIAFHAYATKVCSSEKVKFEDVMTEFNTTYNEGYAKLGKSNVLRPVLKAPSDDVIGGHCVVPNANILKNIFGSDPILESIIRHK